MKKNTHWFLVHALIVELLIRSHDCYTSACDMEGIADVLLRSRSITSNLLQQQEWQLMVNYFVIF